MFTQKNIDAALATWLALNFNLMKYRGAEGHRFAEALYEAEVNGMRRPAYLNRIQGRMDRLRSELRRIELIRNFKRGRRRRQ